jgi:hypothetical protein
MRATISSVTSSLLLVLVIIGYGGPLDFGSGD